MISVIIPSYNEKIDLLECIESLKSQSEKDFEIIIVDDGSTDGTFKTLKDLKHTVRNLLFARQNHKGAGSARNYGFSLSKGNILVFVDADMTFDKFFLQNLTSPIKEGASTGTFSKEEFVSNWENKWAKCWSINERWQSRRRHPANYPDIQPVFRAIKRSEFEKAGGFTPGGYDDDWSLSHKLGYQAVNAPNAIFYHKNPASLKEVYNDARWVGKRKYKLGKLGVAVALCRTFFVNSLITGITMAIKNRLPEFIIFRIVYDAGKFTGLLKYFVTGNASK